MTTSNLKTILQALLFLAMLTPFQVYGYNLKQISKRDGLSNSAILSMCQDREGYMWFGSCDGLNMYDGLRIRVYKPGGDINSLSGNLIEDIVEVGDGIFWVQTNYGLNRFHKWEQTIEEYTFYSSNYRLRTCPLTEVFFIKENGFFVYYNGHTGLFRQVRLAGIDYGEILEYTISEDNTLWVFCRNGKTRTYTVSKKDNHDLLLTETTDFTHPLNLEACFHEDGYVYFVDTSHIFYEYDLQERKKYYITDLNDDLLHKKDISAIIKHHDDFFIGFQTDGLICLRYTPDRPNNYQTEQIDIHSGIFCLLQDKRQDIVWIGTDGQGVFIYSNNPYSIKSVAFQDFTHRIRKPVRSILIDRQGALLLGTKGDGIVKIPDYDFNSPINSDRILYYNASNTRLSDNSVYCLTEGVKEILWIGTEEGLDYYSYRDGVIRNLNIIADGEPVEHVHAIHQQGDSVMWIATVGTGIVKAQLGWDGTAPSVKATKRYKIREGVKSSNYFFTIYAENDSIVWFGNRGYGAFRLNTRTEELISVRLDQINDNQTLNDIFSIAQDERGNFWFGTSYGLVRHNGDEENLVFNERNGLPNNTIHGILKDRRSDLWLSTNFGLVKFDPRSNTFLTFGQNWGLEVVEFSDGAYYSTEDDALLLLGGINGFVALQDNSYYSRNEFLPAIMLNAITVLGEDANVYDFLDSPRSAAIPQYDRHRSRKKQPVLRLSHNQNFFSLSFIGLDYINGSNYTYLYMIEGLNDSWIDNGPSNTIHFTDIKPGEYNLLVKYRNREAGIESPAHSLTIRVNPPWYLSAGAYAFYSAIILLGIFVAIRALVKRSERRREKMLDNIRQEHQKEVYESKLKFFTNIAHEFCTPLTLIHGPCERIIQYRNSDPFITKYAGLIQRNAERMNDLIQQLIDFRRIETGNRPLMVERIAITDLAGNIFDNFTELAESRNVTYERKIEQALIWNSDKNFLETILTNLLSNAFKYTPRGGTVKLTVKTVGSDLKIVVSNTGKGIKAENIQKVFDRYSILEDFENQNENSKTRNGLGLAISYSMIQLLGGDIRVKSVVNQHTDFTVKLPQLPVSQLQDNVTTIMNQINQIGETQEAIELPRYGYDKTRPTILIVDDEKEMLWFICEIFAQEYNVIPVQKSLEVEKILSEMHPSVIISDIMMPGIDGISLTRQIKRNPNTSHVPIILISAKHQVEEQIEGLDAGAEMYITKPFNIDYLKIFVKHLINRKETLKEYFSSPLSAYELTEGKLTHIEHRKFVQKILEIINSNIINKELSAKFIAEKMNMSSRHLYRKINEIGAQSPAEMIRECRLHIAQDLLKNTRLTIDEIIFKSGFANRGPFFKAFSEKYGCTPKEFREKNSQV